MARDKSAKNPKEQESGNAQAGKGPPGQGPVRGNAGASWGAGMGTSTGIPNAPAVSPSGAPGPGIKAGELQEIDGFLRNIQFPTTKRHLQDSVGAQKLMVNGRVTSMQELVSKLRKEEFRDRNEVLRDLGGLPEFQRGP